MKNLIATLLLAALFFSCIPRNQYDSIVTERNYYRNQSALADSLADQRAISSYDEVDLTGSELTQRIRQVEALTATNVSLNQSYQDLEVRYNELLGQSQSMLSDNGSEVTGLQQSLAERSAQVSAREQELRQLELDLQARQEAIERVEGDYAPAGGGQPVSYGTVSRDPGLRPPLSESQNAALKVNTIQNDLNQLLASAGLPGNSYVVAPAGNNRLQVSLAEGNLSSDGFTISLAGQQLLRRMATTLRNYPSVEYTVIGHADGANPNALRAYEDSTDKAINVAQQLVNYGLDPAKITAGGKGFYSPVADSSTPAGQAANRRMDILLTVPE